MIVDERTIESDPLSLTLASLSWSGWQSGVAHLMTPWGADVPEGHVSLYVVRGGAVWVTSPTLSSPIHAVPGDLLLFPTGSRHQLLSTLDAPVQPFDEILSPHRARWLGSAEIPAGSTTLVYGHLTTSGTNSNPLHSNLSRFLHLKLGEFESLQRAEDLLQLLEREQREMQPGWQAIANQLVQVIFHQALRGFVSRGLRAARPTESNTAALVSDPVMGLVVGLLHSQPEKPWTVASLARWVHMSRSAFSERFRQVVGKPPLNYLTELRMSKACELLRGSDLGVKQIATIVGYESPSSFTNAFKRWNGTSPAAYRGHSEVEVEAEVEAELDTDIATTSQRI